MEQNKLNEIIEDQTKRALWEVKNVIDCVPDSLWNKEYCDMPLWKHIYHMLHSLDLWFINPRDKHYCEPSIHSENLNNLDIITDKTLSRNDIENYFKEIEIKITDYITKLNDEELLDYPENCEYTKFTLILAQYRHLHTHMGIIMGFIIDDTGLWPNLLGLTRPIPHNEDYNKYC